MKTKSLVFVGLLALLVLFGCLKGGENAPAKSNANVSYSINGSNFGNLSDSDISPISVTGSGSNDSAVISDISLIDDQNDSLLISEENIIEPG
ncbi:hypothetical protein HY988_03680 [Candidatus Micrarchaeota archaeon]|nr:hypothetical protein [Candidatus Micrarchaeota archaeon]